MSTTAGHIAVKVLICTGLAVATLVIAPKVARYVSDSLLNK